MTSLAANQREEPRSFLETTCVAGFAQSLLTAGFGDLIDEAHTIIVNHPPQERCQLGELFVW